jgi:hypothetical protein
LLAIPAFAVAVILGGAPKLSAQNAYITNSGDGGYRVGFCYIRSGTCVVGNIKAPTRERCEAIARQMNLNIVQPPTYYTINGGWYRCLGRVKGWGLPPFEVVPWALAKWYIGSGETQGACREHVKGA